MRSQLPTTPARLARARAKPPLQLAPPPLPPTALLGAAGLSYLLRSTELGVRLSPPMLAFTFALGLSNVGVLPATHAGYDACVGVALPLSVSMGLLSAPAAAGAASAAPASTAVAASPTSPPAAPDVDARLGAALLAFAIGAVGSALGALLAFALAAVSLHPHGSSRSATAATQWHTAHEQAHT